MVGSITYPLYAIVPVKRGDHFTLCNQVETNLLLYVKNEYIEQKETGVFVAKKDVSCAEITVYKGDHVALVDDSCSGYDLIKRDGLLGWVPKTVLE